MDFLPLLLCKSGTQMHFSAINSMANPLERAVRLTRHRTLPALLGCFALFGQAFAENATSAETENPPVLLRGVLNTADTWAFSLERAGSEQSFWLKIGDTRHGITPTAYDPATEKLHLRLQGRKHTIRLQTPDSTPLPVVGKKHKKKRITTKLGTVEIPPVPSKRPGQPPNKGRPPGSSAPNTIPSKPGGANR